MKSPNMMSTTGRKPVIAAPTPTPVKPASEIGVSTTREVPNSSTRPERTLNGVPASATSSPMMKTRASRRISSASASRIASANVISRVPVSGIDVLVNLVRSRIWRGDREFHRLFHFHFQLCVNRAQRACICVLLRFQPCGKILDGIAFGQPLLLFFFRPVIFAIDIANVVPAIPVGVAQQKCRAFAATRAFRQPFRGCIHRAYVLAVHRFGAHAERLAPQRDVARGGFRKMR